MASALKARHWGIFGGGMLGMTLAHELAKRGERVTLCEAGDRLGGLASAWQLGDWVWDRHYHVTLLSDSALRGLLGELDLDREMRWARTLTGFYAAGRLYPVSTPVELLRLPVLGWIEKLRLAWTLFSTSRLKDIAPLESVSVEEWLIAQSGRAAYRKFWSPLLRSKLGADYSNVAASFIGATIQRLSAARNAGLKEEMFGYLPGGYDRLLTRFECELRKERVWIEPGRAIRRVESRRPSGVEVTFTDGNTSTFDRVVLTMPSSIAASVCPALTASEIERLNGIEYQGIICASLLLTRPLSPYYVTNLADASLPFTGVIEMTTLVDRQTFGGNTLVYLPRYVRPDDEAFNLSDRELREEFLSGLFRMHPTLRAADVLTFQVSRVRQVFARPTLNYSAHLPPVDTSIPGVHILNSAHITTGTLNVNETVALAQSHAARLSELS